MGSDVALGSLPTNEWNRVHGLISEYEKARRSNSTTDLIQFLPDEKDMLYLVSLVELIKSDMDFSWRGGVQILVEEYLAKYAALKKNPAEVSKLLREEYRIRQECGERPVLDEYKRRFPEYYRDFEKLIQNSGDQTNPVQSDTREPAAPSRSIRSESKALASGEKIDVGDGYRLIELLGEGKFGKVWKAESANGKFVAVKIITWPADHPAAQRELQSLEILKNVSHPYLLEIHSFYSWKDRIVVVMGLADGSLRDRLIDCQRKNEPAIPLEELLPYMSEAAEALDFLNRKDIQHRDIKPGNILLAASHVRIGDLGLAKIVMEGQMNASILGTPPYMAPEVWLGKVHDNSDQYSLAVTYLELRRGRRAFETGQINGLEEKHLFDTPGLASLSDAERKILLRAGSKDPDQRFSSCAEFVSTLTEVLRPNRPVGYRKLKRINSGSFGDVWRGEAPGGKSVAIKTIRLADRKSVESELKALEYIKDLEHPHLVTIFAFWNEEEELHIAMTLADRSLRDFLSHRQQYYPEEGIPRPKLHQYMLETAQALDFLHTRDIVHRDVKPENILLKDDRVKVADFGLAKMMERQQLFTATMSGTMAYMSPEAWSGKVSKRSDQYSLAVSYYELRTGKPLFTPGNMHDMMMAHSSSEPDLSALPEEERSIVGRALAKNSEDRFEFCFDFVNNLKLVHAPPTVNIRPDTIDETGTIHPESQDSDPTPRISSGRIQVWRESQGRWSDKKIWRYVIMLTAVALFSGAAAFMFLRPSGPEPDVKMTVTKALATAGETSKLQIMVRREYWDGALPITLQLPDGITTEKNKITVAENESTKDIPITVSADVYPKKYKASIFAKLPDGDEDLPFELEVLPLPTLPTISQAGKFVPVQPIEILEIGPKKYYMKIDCVLKYDRTTRVRFHLIYPKDTKKNLFKPFYAMRDMVTNGLFEIYADKLGHVKSEDPKKEPEWKNGGGRPNDSGDFDPLGSQNSRWPVLRVDYDYPEAQGFAEWLGGDIPTKDEWDWAAGKYQTNGLREGPFIPMEINASSIIGSVANGQGNPFSTLAGIRNYPGIAYRLRTPVPVGMSLWDVSPFGCRDMSGNGFEWTSTVLSIDTLFTVLRSQNYYEKFHPYRLDGDEGRKKFRMRKSGMGEPLHAIGFRVIVRAKD